MITLNGSEEVLSKQFEGLFFNTALVEEKSNTADGDGVYKIMSRQPNFFS